MINTEPDMNTGMHRQSTKIDSTCRTVRGDCTASTYKVETGDCNGLAHLDDLSCHAAAPQDSARVANAQDSKHDDACMTIDSNLKRASQHLCQTFITLPRLIADCSIAYAVLAISMID